MADKVDKKATWMNVSCSPQPRIENMTVQASSERAGASIDLQGLIEVGKSVRDAISEGFKKDLMVAVQELDQSADNILLAIADQIQHFDTMASHSEAILHVLDKVHGEMHGISHHLAQISQINPKVDLNPLVRALSELKLKAEIPMSGLTVGLPKGVVWYALLSPIAYGVIFWGLLKMGLH